MKPYQFNGNAINDGTNYISSILPSAYGLPDVDVMLAGRTGLWPKVGAIERPGRGIALQIIIVGADTTTLQKQLYQWFDPETETPGTLQLQDDSGGPNYRYVKAICRAMQPVGGLKGKAWIASLQIDGDVRLREVTATTDQKLITASAQTKVLANGGQDEAYPVITLTPTSNKTGGYAYKVFWPVRWRATGESAVNYPFDICNDSFNTAALVTGSKMQADGDDLRVTVDGVEIARWLDGINTTTTKVWVNLDFAAPIEMTLAVAIDADDTSLTVSESASETAGIPQSGGILYIGTEVIRYTAYSPGVGFTGLTRGAESSTAATHAVSDTVIWLQHEIYTLYGNSTATAPTVDDNYKPIFSLASSTNTSWVYAEFGEDDGLRTGAWEQASTLSEPDFYGGNQGAAADPWVELGISVGGSICRIYLINPCGITAANWTNGEKYSSSLSSIWRAALKSRTGGGSYTTDYNIPEPTVAATWQTWSQNVTSLTVTEIALEVSLGTLDASVKVECADVTVTLDSAVTPTTAVGVEQTNYQLACTLTNETTGEAIQLAFNMQLNQGLKVDTYNKEITYLLTNSKRFSALTLVGGARKHWLKLAVGNNTIRYDETGVAGLTLDFSWEERHYQ